MKITISDIDAFVFDFDGVLTNNKVFVDEHGVESVSCSRSDGMAFDVLRRLNKPVYIMSTEKNTVVAARAKKLNIPVLQNIGNKAETLKKLVNINSYEVDRILFVGNDLNDYQAMELCGLSACPSDSHPRIKKISTFVLKAGGGSGVVRELLEEVLDLDFVEILF